ncbi:MAG TPA: PAC2 family protein [Microbacteriaceae bacterium]|nr:PAC2 family protein [Microbacteriaceae bacterium]
MTVLPAATRIPSGVPLVAALTGFMDTGSTIGQLIDHFDDNLNTEVVVEFDLDELYDYRARRPIISFDQDHLTDFQPPRLDLRLAHDDLGSPFLLLSGVEPDFRWNAFVRAIVDLVERFQVASFNWAHAIPMPAPHTRPIQVTVSGNRDDLIERYSVWRPQTAVPSNILHVLEYRLADRMTSVGFVLLVPHYLGDNSYPDSAIKAIECLSAATGLILPTDELREEGREFSRRLTEQTEDNEEFQSLVHGLEQRHDAFMAGTSVAANDPIELADGEQIAAEWERFLANRQQPDGDARPDWNEPGL